MWQIPFAECECVYIGETGRTLEKRLSEHNRAVKRNDTKNRIAVHTWKTQHKVDWEAATVKQVRQTTHEEGLLKLYTSESKKQHPTLTAAST